MRKQLFPIIAIAIMLVIGACSNEELMSETETESGNTISLEVIIPDDNPTSRVSLERDEVNKKTVLKWQEGDELQLAFVQGENKATGTATASNISGDGKKAQFAIVIPQGFDTGVFDLYGVYGGQGIDITANPVAILPTNAGGATSLEDLQTRKDVMLYFESTSIDANNPQVSVAFQHLGSLFCVILNNIGETSLDNLQEAQLVGINNTGNQNWAYNSVDGARGFDLVAGAFQGAASWGNVLSFAAAQNSLPANGSISFWGWYPPLKVGGWPELQLQLNDGSAVTVTSVNTKSARTVATSAGRSYYFFATWNGENLEFTDETFGEYTVHVPTRGDLSTLLTPTQKKYLKKLTVTGEINKADYNVMRNEMPILRVVDLSEVTSYDGTTANKIPTDAFGGANPNTTITSVILPNSLTAIGTNAFYFCRSLTGNLILPANLSSIGEQAFRHTKLTGNLIIPDGVKSISENAFSNCYGFTGLTLPANLETIAPRAFTSCNGLIGNLIIPHSVTSIGEDAFMDCTNLTGDLIIPQGMKTIERYAFSGCGKFTSLTLSENLETIGYAAFNQCTGFTGNLIIPNSVTSIGEFAFNQCTGFTGNLVISDSVTTIKKNAFYGCGRFKGSLTLPANLKTIEEKAFYQCEGFTDNLIIPDGVTKIDASAFTYCRGFTSLTLPTSLTSIGSTAFVDCLGLTGTLILPENLTTIGDYAFFGCEGITAFKFPHTTPIAYTDKMLWTGTNSNIGTTPIQVPASVVNAYKAATGWSDHAAYIAGY